MQCSGRGADASCVAKARGLPEAKVRQFVEDQTSSRLLGIIGEPHVNVLRLKLALDELKG